jgi:UDPglucose--hexose-1-phosphate uridylyltransferase
MPQLRRDPIVGRWVIIDTDDPAKPGDFEKEIIRWNRKNCPFCYGNESMTPPEVLSFRHDSTAPNTAGWTVRVVPNKFPALKIEGDLGKRGIGMFDMSNGIGAHEVVVETPYHEKSIPDLLNEEICDVVKAYCMRAIDLIKDSRFKYILIFKNFGSSAGASLQHNHTQLIALPMIPKNVAEELAGSLRYFEYRGRCIFCDMIYQEYQDKERIISENRNFIAFCPFSSRFPFEVWIVPKKHNPYFCHISDEEKFDFGLILKETLSRVRVVLSDPAYNFIIHGSPFDEGYKDSYHWHLELMPKLIRVAGFEWGTGFYIVPVPPEAAASYLREVVF